jgi:hypothetical protein
VLVITGGGPQRPDAARWVRALTPTADAIAAAVPDAERATLECEGHVADPRALAALLTRFFDG